jgi:hypothetical protein
MTSHVIVHGTHMAMLAVGKYRYYYSKAKWLIGLAHNRGHRLIKFPVNSVLEYKIHDNALDFSYVVITRNLLSSSADQRILPGTSDG